MTTMMHPLKDLVMGKIITRLKSPIKVPFLGYILTSTAPHPKHLELARLL
jgi:hypothetical protein